MPHSCGTGAFISVKMYYLYVSEYNCINSSKYGIILDINIPRYSHIRTVRVCAARKPPIFRPLPLLKPLLFRPGPLQKTPFTVRVCAARKLSPRRPAPPPPFFGLCRSLSLYFFELGRSKRLPFQKHTMLCTTFPTWTDRKHPRFKKIYVSLLFLAPKSPVFPVRGPSESPSFSVRGRSLSLPFLNPARHIYTKPLVKIWAYTEKLHKCSVRQVV